MRRVLFTWRGVRVWSYPAMLYLGLLAGMGLQNAAARVSGLPPFRVYLVTLLLLPVALAGARLLFVASHWHECRADRSRIWRRGEGGMSMYGGVPCMLAASVPLLVALDVPYRAFWDATVFCIFPGMAFTRIGCLLNGCCAGRPTTGRIGMWAADYRGTVARRVPVQLYQSAAAILITIACGALRPSLQRPGMLFLVSVVMYACGRLVFERLRDEREKIWRFDLQAAISLALIAGGITGLILLRS